MDTITWIFYGIAVFASFGFVVYGFLYLMFQSELFKELAGMAGWIALVSGLLALITWLI